MVRDVRLSALGIAVLCLVTGQAVQSTPQSPMSLTQRTWNWRVERSSGSLLYSFIFQLLGWGRHRWTWSVVTFRASSCVLVCKELSAAITTSNTGSKEGKCAGGAGYQGKLGEGYPNEKKEKHDSKWLWHSSRSSLEPVKKIWWHSALRLWSILHENNNKKHLRFPTEPERLWYSTIPAIAHIPYRLLSKSPMGKLIVCLTFNQFLPQKRYGLVPSMPHFSTEL